MFTNPAGFQYPEEASSTDAITVFDIPKALALTPRFRNSLEYFGAFN